LDVRVRPDGDRHRRHHPADRHRQESQILTLYTTPVVYLYLDKLQHWLSPAKARNTPRLANAMRPQAEAAE